MTNFISELKRRGVVRSCISYLIMAWLVVQVISVVGPALGLTERFMQYTLIVLAVGFPLAMLVSWFYEINTQGITREIEVAEQTPKTKTSGSNFDFIIITTLIIALVGSWVYFGVKPALETENSTRTNVLAILPLTKVSNNTADNGFVDGLHLDLLGSLSRLEPLQVISRTSVLGFQNTTASISQIGNQLGADKIIEGSVQLSSELIRITIRLIDVQTDASMWSQTYEEEFNATELFALQRDIALSVANELKVTLSLSEDERLNKVPTESTEAYREYLLGKTRAQERTSESLDIAQNYLQKAIAIDPEFAEAYVALALVHNLQYYNSNLPLDEMRTKVMPLIERALTLDNSLSDAFVVLASLRELNDDLKGSEDAFTQALKLNPNNALARHWYGIFLTDRGRLQEGLEQHLKAQKIDPLSPIISVTVAQDFTYLGDFEKALEEYQRTLEIKPDFVPAYAHMAALYGRSKKRPDEAVRWLRKAWEMDPGHTEYPSQMAETLLDLGDPINAGLWADIAYELGPTQYWPNRAKILHAFYTGDQQAIAEHAKILLGIYSVQFHSLMHKTENLIAQNKPSEAKALFLPRLASLIETKPDLSANINARNYASSILFAQALIANGETDKAEPILRASLAQMEDLPRLGFGGKDLFDVAAANLLGDQDAALAFLEQAQNSPFSAGWWMLNRVALFEGITNNQQAKEYTVEMSTYMQELIATLDDEHIPP